MGGNQTETQMSGRRKAAMLMVRLGPEVAADVFKHLSEEEITEKIRLSGGEDCDLAMALPRGIGEALAEIACRRTDERRVAFKTADKIIGAPALE